MPQPSATITVQSVAIPTDGTPATITAASGKYIVATYYEVGGAANGPHYDSDSLVATVYTRDSSDRITAVEFTCATGFGEFVGYATSL